MSVSHRRPYATHFGQGLLMGGADVIPGVSGGTVALIVGIYEPLVSSIRAGASMLVAVLRGDRERARERFHEVRWGLVLPLAAGIAGAIGVGSLVIPTLLERYPSRMLGLFFGLILGSLAIPWRRVEGPGPKDVGVAVLAAVVAFVLVGLPPREVSDPSLLQVFGAAAVAICAMILPGISGAFLLLVLGVYEVTLEALRSLDIPYVLTFIAGAVVGLGVFARLLEHLLERRHRMTMAALVGLMAGSLRALWPWQTDDRGLAAPSLDGSVPVVLLLAVAGFVAVRILDRFGHRILEERPLVE